MSRGNRSRPAHERTAQEREHDRLERERRRAERATPGAPAPGGLSDDTAELPEAETAEPRRPESVREPPQSGTADAAGAVPPLAVPPVPEPAAAPEHVEPAPAPQPAEPVRVEAQLKPGSGEGLHEPPVHEDAPALGHEGEHGGPEDSPAHPPPWAVRGGAPAAPADSPAPPPDLPAGGRISQPGVRAGGAGAAVAGARGRRGARSGARHGGRRLTRARGAALLALLAAVALVWFLVSLFQPFAGSGSGKVIVSIPKGSSSSRIGSILAHDGVVSSGFFFDVRALLAGKRSSLHSGRFALKRDMSYTAAIDALSKPPPRVIAVKVVVPEGYTRRQIADLVAEDALTGSYLAATRRSSVLDPSRYGAPASTKSLEGFLFPATYELTAGAPVKRLVDEQLTAFRRRFTAADRRRAHALGVTPYQLLTVASMIEREAQTDHDRPLIAAVIYNRLREGIPLGIDATTYYAVALQKGIATYTGELTESQLKVDSPYNTRTHKGLPPTPISNPGEASIGAAAHPSHTHFLYYVAGADGCGEQAFSDTYAQFQRNVAAYQAAVKRNGGHPPKCKKK